MPHHFFTSIDLDAPHTHAVWKWELTFTLWMLHIKYWLSNIRNWILNKSKITIKLIQTCIPDCHVHRVAYTRCCIDTVNSPDDGHIAVWNMYIIEINIHEKELCVKLVIYKDYTGMHSQQNIKILPEPLNPIHIITALPHVSIVCAVFSYQIITSSSPSSRITVLGGT